MGSLHHFEKTSMIQPDNSLFENYRETKAEMRRIEESQQVENNRLIILQEANERLNTEVQRLKKALSDSKRHEPEIRIAQTPKSNNDKKYQEHIQKLELALKNEKRKNQKLTNNIGKLEQLLEDVYAAEKENSIQEEEVMNIKKVNAQLLAMLQRLNNN